MVEIAGKALDGSAFAEKTIEVYRAGGKKDPAGMEIQIVRDKNQEQSVIVTMDLFPAIKIRGSAPDDRGEFNLTSLDYLGGSPQGWNEYRMDIIGGGRIVLSGQSVVLSVHDEAEIIQISSGRIRRYDTRITGNEALASLRNRHERIQALAEWMNSQRMNSLENAPVFTDVKKFERHWKPVLFPEAVPKRKRPAQWQQENDLWTKAEDIKWNSSYTERNFPQELRAVRDSGTMLRDWEEALEWIIIKYEWTRIWERLSEENIFTRKK
jgi:hypothetical protein